MHYSSSTSHLTWVFNWLIITTLESKTTSLEDVWFGLFSHFWYPESLPGLGIAIGSRGQGHSVKCLGFVVFFLWDDYPHSQSWFSVVLLISKRAVRVISR
jgi:hypothetical protein